MSDRLPELHLKLEVRRGDCDAVLSDVAPSNVDTLLLNLQAFVTSLDCD